MPATHLGRADEVNVIGDENGFELHIHTAEGTFVVNIQSIAEAVLLEVNREIGGWIAEGVAARIERDESLAATYDDDGAYDVNDPKHPGWSVGV